MANKYHKVGTVQRKKDKSGTYISLGNPNGKKYAYTVDIKVTDATGQEVFRGTNVALFIQDPRNRPGITEEQKAKIPDFIVNELFVIEKDVD